MSARRTRKPATGRKKNGHGGARKGAGAPRAKLGKAELDAMGEPPVDDPIACAGWLNRALIRIWWAEAQGKCSPELAQRLRSSAGAIIRSLPDAARAALDRRLKTGGERTGPALQPVKAKDGPPTYRG